MIFFIIFIAGFVLHAVWKDIQQKRHEIFKTAARALDLNHSVEGLVFRKHWLSGIKGKFRIDAGPYGEAENGMQRRHMGYRISFREPLALASGECEDARSRLIAGFPGLFQECEVDGEGIFFARTEVPADGAIIVADIDRLLREAGRIVESAGTSPAPEIFVVPVPQNAREIRRENAEPPRLPPPLPDRTAEPEQETAAPEANADPDVSAEETFVFESDEPDSDSGASPPLFASPFTADPDEPTTLDLALLDLFSAGRNRYETGKRFESEHRGKEVEGSGMLRKVDRYSHDRIFGRGPGRIALVEVRLGASDGSAPLNATLYADLPEDHGASDLIGKKVDLAGTLVGCDPFSSRIYLTTSVLE